MHGPLNYLMPYPGVEAEYDFLVVDTEFTRLPMKKEAVWSWAEHCRLLAVAIAPLAQSEKPDHFYATRKISKAILSMCNPFVRETVIPSMGASVATVAFDEEANLQSSLKSYLATRRRSTGKPPLLAVDWIGDAYLLRPLFEDEPAWLLLDRVPQIEFALDAGWPAERTRHNALHDAEVIRAAFATTLGWSNASD